jgi:hypothetical protein
MPVSLTIVRYKKSLVPFALLSMALFRIPLSASKGISFWKLMGCGNNGTFDINPDWQQWCILCVHEETELENQQLTTPKILYGNFIDSWWRFFGCEIYTVLLEPIQSHGYWNGKQPFRVTKNPIQSGRVIAVLTRATIRIKRLKNFWINVPSVAKKITQAEGFITSVGIGELPFIRQATFSVWQSKEHMQGFAYKMREHSEIIKKTKTEDWYSEELFARFTIIAVKGSMKGENPLSNISLI